VTSIFNLPTSTWHIFLLLRRINFARSCHTATPLRPRHILTSHVRVVPPPRQTPQPTLEPLGRHQPLALYTAVLKSNAAPPVRKHVPTTTTSSSCYVTNTDYRRPGRTTPVLPSPSPPSSLSQACYYMRRRRVERTVERGGTAVRTEPIARWFDQSQADPRATKRRESAEWQITWHFRKVGGHMCCECLVCVLAWTGVASRHTHHPRNSAFRSLHLLFR